MTREQIVDTIAAVFQKAGEIGSSDLNYSRSFAILIVDELIKDRHITPSEIQNLQIKSEALFKSLKKT